MIAMPPSLAFKARRRGSLEYAQLAEDVRASASLKPAVLGFPPIIGLVGDALLTVRLADAFARLCFLQNRYDLLPR